MGLKKLEDRTYHHTTKTKMARAHVRDVRH